MWNMYIVGEVGGMGEFLVCFLEMVSVFEEKVCLIEVFNCFDSLVFYELFLKNIDDICNRYVN